MTTLQLYLPIYLLLYFSVAFVMPSYRTYKQTGINPITFGNTDNAHDYIGFVMKVLIGLLFAMVLCFSFGQKLYVFCSPILFLENQHIQFIGLVLIHVSLIWIAVAQFQMGQSWRIGIDQEHTTELVSSGVFSISRNPIFLGMIISIFGIFLILPSAISFFLCMATYLVIQIQVRLEEEFLQKNHQTEYENYRGQVRRWL